MNFGGRKALWKLTELWKNQKTVFPQLLEPAVHSSHNAGCCWSFLKHNFSSTPNERWSIDFLSDCVSTGRVIRMLTMVDDYTRECPTIEVDTSLGGLRVRRVLDRVAAERGLPEAIVLDNGPEFRGQAGAECLRGAGRSKHAKTPAVIEKMYIVIYNLA